MRAGPVPDRYGHIKQLLKTEKLMSTRYIPATKQTNTGLENSSAGLTQHKKPDRGLIGAKTGTAMGVDW